MSKTGKDIRNGQKVKILRQRIDQCKTNRAVVLSSSGPNQQGWCVPLHTLFLPGGIVSNEYLCEYPDGSITWVDGKNIFMFEV